MASCLFLRCDPLAHRANPGKVAALRAVLRAYRAGAALVAREQWRRLAETGHLNKMHRSPEEPALAAVVGAANRLQMVRSQVVGMLDGWLKAAPTRSPASCRPHRWPPS